MSEEKSQPFTETVFDRFQSDLRRMQKEKNLKAIILSSIDEDENPDPTLDDLHALRTIFVSEQTENEINSLSTKLALVGNNGPDDYLATHSSLEYYAIFKSANRKMKLSWNRRKYKQCMNRLLAIIVGFKDFDYGFLDTECPEVAQGILTKTCNVWRDVMKLDANTIGLEEDGKRVLFEVMTDLKKEMSQIDGCDYRMNIGSYQQPTLQDEDEDIDLNHNRLKRRKRQRSIESYFDGEIKAEDEENEEPQRKKRRVQSVADEYKDDEVEPYQMSELNGKKVNDLKELLRNQHFPVSGSKQTLIDRLLYPKRAIVEMKKGYHRIRCGSRRLLFFSWESQSVINAAYKRANKFNPDLYVFKSGKISTIPWGERYDEIWGTGIDII